MRKTYKRFAAVIFVVACFCVAYLFFSDVVVHVTGPAVVKIARVAGQSPTGAASSDISYPTQIAGYGESGPHVFTIRARPVFTLSAFDGELLGSDRGEWGGELVFRDRIGAVHRLINRDVRGIVRMPFGIVVFTGLAHMGSSTGGIYSVARRTDGAVAATLIHDLRGAPEAIRWTTRGDLVFQVDIQELRPRGLFGGQRTRCLLLDRSGALRKQLCAAIMDTRHGS